MLWKVCLSQVVYHTWRTAENFHVDVSVISVDRYNVTEQSLDWIGSTGFLTLVVMDLLSRDHYVSRLIQA